MTDKLPNIHPGEVLREEFLVPMGLSQNALARAIGVPPRRISEIVLGKRAISADTAIRLARYFGTSEKFWMGLQVDYDLEQAREKDAAEPRRRPAPDPAIFEKRGLSPFPSIHPGHR